MQGKILHQCNILFNSAWCKSIQLAQQLKNEITPATEVLVATVEGVEVAIAQETIPLLKCEIGGVQKSPIKLHEKSQIITKNVEEVNQCPISIFKNGYHEVNGFKFTDYYYNRLWKNGRGGATFRAKEILENATKITPDPRYIGFFIYIFDGWEMAYNPIIKEVSHISPISKFK